LLTVDELMPLLLVVEGLSEAELRLVDGLVEVVRLVVFVAVRVPAEAALLLLLVGAVQVPAVPLLIKAVVMQAEAALLLVFVAVRVLVEAALLLVVGAVQVPAETAQLLLIKAVMVQAEAARLEGTARLLAMAKVHQGTMQPQPTVQQVQMLLITNNLMVRTSH
jgi:hypothetical protein